MIKKLILFPIFFLKVTQLEGEFLKGTMCNKVDLNKCK